MRPSAAARRRCLKTYLQAHRLNTEFYEPALRWDQAYEESADLFGPKTRKLRDSGQRLLEWYRGRLEAAFGHVSPARLIRNTRGGHLYYLIWAGPQLQDR
ncbi:hypothetical protein [Falsiroseomonas sp. HW251]|uniref:hypothetical protein n=1 Tax=Falsiroseomonas sp. HW251 TaxID=3390998 RepID=UPI003D317D40